jgi:AcrR family transcriptional regulator
MSPRTPEQLEEHRRERRALILDAAMDLFAHQGFESTSISQIAKQAGISKGLMYNYFDDKDDLLNQVIMNAIQKLPYLFEEMQIDQANAANILYDMLHRIRQSVDQETVYWRLYAQLGVQLMDKLEVLHERFSGELQQYEQNIYRLMEVLKPNQPTDLQVQFFNAALDGVVQHQLMNPQFKTEAVYNKLFEQFTKQA